MADNNNTNINTEDNTQVVETPAPEDTSSKETGSTEVMYTEAELASRISSAVNKALQKAKQSSDKSAADVAQELADLRAELAREKNVAYVASEVTKQGIPSELTELFYSEDNEVSKSRLSKFTKWYSKAIDSAVEARLNATETPQFTASQPGVSANKSLGNFAQWVQNHPSN